MEGYIAIKINLSVSKMNLGQLWDFYRVSEHDPLDMEFGKDVEVTFYKKPSEISMIGKYI